MVGGERPMLIVYKAQRLMSLMEKGRLSANMAITLHFGQCVWSLQVKIASEGQGGSTAETLSSRRERIAQAHW